MIKNLLNLGFFITKKQQKSIRGGNFLPCYTNRDCVDLTTSYDYTCRFVSNSPPFKQCVIL